ncbi:MAG: hypothetical protein BWX79_02382 [Alphaproteobacteria bacterium ADurb.Bin100]|nr:MAG: hypothetical protein BWX79_02382 [Alphaproteobacteria bacterium ADurb.Bin100]
MILVGVQRNPLVSQSAAHDSVAFDRLRLIVMVGKDRLDAQAKGQPRNFLARHGMADDEAGVFLSCQFAQVLVQGHERLPDELDAPIGPRKWIQDLLIQDEHAMHLRAIPERVMERSIVLGAKIAPEPHQPLVKSLGSVHR